jgi:hypothetical protein
VEADTSLRDLARMAEIIEAEGWAQRHLAVSPAFRERFGTEVLRYGSAVGLVTRHIDFPALNRVFSLGVHEPLTTERLDEIVGGDAFARVSCSAGMLTGRRARQILPLM